MSSLKFCPNCGGTKFDGNDIENSNLNNEIKETNNHIENNQNLKNNYQNTSISSSSVSNYNVSLDVNGKNMIVAYAFWWFLGSIGAHRFYLGRSKTAIGMIVLLILGLITSIVGVGYLLLAALGVWWLVDGFLVYRYVSEANNSLGISPVSLGFAASKSKSLTDSEQLDYLAKLHDLKEKGVLSEQEYQQKKALIIR